MWLGWGVWLIGFGRRYGVFVGPISGADSLPRMHSRHPIVIVLLDHAGLNKVFDDLHILLGQFLENFPVTRESAGDVHLKKLF